MVLDNSTLSLTVGQTDSLVVTVNLTGDISNQPISWTSGNTKVVSIKEGETHSVSKNKTGSAYSATAYITGLSVGTSEITVKAGNKSVICEVTVNDIYPTLTHADLYYYGDTYETYLSNNFIIYLGSAGIIFTDSTIIGNGEALTLELNSLLTATDSIPSGTYEMITDTLFARNMKPFTLVPAYTNNDEQLWGCWYYGNTFNMITQGNIVVKRTGSIYSINYELFDGYGAKISGIYTGPMTYFDKSKSVPAEVKKRYLKAKKPGVSKNSLNIKRFYN